MNPTLCSGEGLTLKMSASKSRCGVYCAFINFNGNSLSETSLWGVIVDVLIKTSIQSKMMNTATMIP